MSVTPSAAEPAAHRVPKLFALRDLAVAPENLRFAEPPDDGIAELAATIRAADLLQPLTVRPGKRKEKPAMVLDGRRRLLALQALLAAGEIADDHPVSAFEETAPERQTAAIFLTNTAVPVHVADVIVAIGKMTKAKLTPAAIAAALGYAEVDVRRLAVLAALHPKALEALKAGRVTLRQARLLARLPNRRAQGEIAEMALNGFGFQEWRVTERLDRGLVTVRDRRFRLVGAARYAAAGGRIESDLFGERPEVVLDPEVLQDAWTARATALVQGLAAGGAQVLVAVAAPEIDDPAFEPFGDAYGFGLDTEGLAAWGTAQEALEAAGAALADCDWAAPETDAAIAALLAAKLAADVASEPARAVTLIQVISDNATALSLRAYGPPVPVADDPEPEDEDDLETDTAEDVVLRRPAVTTPTPVAVAPAPDLAGVGHALHAVRTDVATRALIRALADDPGVALTALVARLFMVLVLHRGRGRGEGALTLEAEAYGRPHAPPLEALDGDVRRRLAERRAGWEAGGGSPIAWVATLPQDEKLAMLAELVALSLDLREERTTPVRRAARAEAVEIAALCQADVTRHWTPDAAFLAAHPKPKLLDMLDEMGAGDTRAAACRKDELVARVAAKAADRGWAPAYLSWAAIPPCELEAEAEADGDLEDRPADETPLAT